MLYLSIYIDKKGVLAADGLGRPKSTSPRPRIYPNMKSLQLLHERLIKAALSFYTTKVATLASSVLFYGGTSPLS
jgi:hypothetical protein